MLIRVEVTEKISWSQVRRVWRMLQCCYIVLSSGIVDQNRLVCWSIVAKEKPTVGSLFFGVFPSDLFSKATKDVNVHSFIRRSNSCKLHQRIPGNFRSYYIYIWVDIYGITDVGNILIV